MDHNGPHTWKILYPESKGNNQSPINIATRLAVVVEPSEALRWTGYNVPPSSMIIMNDKNTVQIATSWNTATRPYIQGGPLSDTYDFCSIVFHWGLSDEGGSEHTINYIRYPMELQAIHVKRGFNSPVEPAALGAKDGVMILSFFFELTSADNPYLDQIVTNLWRIAQVGATAHIPPFPLEWILPPFEKNYYTYNGSLTQPPCSEIVTWIIQPEPIAISPYQVAEFRKMCSENGPTLANCRPVQRLNERDVFFYE
ncbi:hypothetical protein KM043_007020 [Ampulex compressa]|nr:hypothetical protein KM043_007020 [Ampulex compressa]